jgi:hypothetical protein
MTHARRVGLGIVLVTAGAAAMACGLRQNLRNQFLSYRGAWQCPDAACVQGQMSRSTRGSRSGTVDITNVKMNPKVVMVVNAGAVPEAFSAKVSCGGAAEGVPADKIRPPGDHKISGQADSYAVIIDPADYSFKNCTSYRLLAHAEWENGKRKFDLEAGLSVQ